MDKGATLRHFPREEDLLQKSAASKPRQRRLKPDDRRQQLIETTLLCLAKYGAEGTGVRQVCRELGVAPSLVNYFFDGWNDLLLSAYQALAERDIQDLQQLLAADYPSERARLRAVVERSIAPDWLSENVVGAYIALWDLSRTLKDLQAAFGRFHRERRALLAGLLERLAEECGVTADAERLAAGLVIFLDGLWLELGLNPDSIPHDEAIELCWIWVEANFPERGKKRG